MTARQVVRWTEKAARPIVYDRSMGACEGCNQHQATQVHHRKNRSQGGTWDPDNLMHLCLWCHGWVGREVELARRAGWAVRGSGDPSLVPVYAWADPWGVAWWFIDGRFHIFEGAHDAALALGMPEVPEVPDYRRTA